MSEISENNTNLERFSKLKLTSDELGVIQGVSYGTLSESFNISQRVLEACTNVNRSKYVRITSVEASRRASNYFSQKLSDGDETAERHLKSSLGMEGGTTEFMQSLYVVDSDVVVGSIHKGMFNSITFAKDMDGIPDTKRVVQIHKHFKDIPQSLQDLTLIISDDESTPSKCMYFVTGPHSIYLLFPTNDSPRLDMSTLKENMGKIKYKDHSEYLTRFREIVAKSIK